MRMLRDTETRADLFLSARIEDPRSSDFGAVVADWGGMTWGYADPKPTLHLAAAAMSVFLNRDSRHYLNPAIPEAFSQALGYAERVQNPDGTFDYRPCNFRSAPDTAFIVNRIVVTLRLIERLLADEKNKAGAGPAGVDVAGTAKNEAAGCAGRDGGAGLVLRLGEIAARLRALILKAGDGMAAGGFHTPNHRWAIAAALSSCYTIGGNEKHRSRAEDYLREGIDGTREGEYAERSAGNYNMVNNDQMIILAAERADPVYLGFARRNLEMMLTYIEPDGSVFTNNSTRQDRGVKTWLDNYYFNYLYLGEKLKLPGFLAVARRIMDGIIAAGRVAPDFLDWIMLEFGGIDYARAESESSAGDSPRGPDDAWQAFAATPLCGLDGGSTFSADYERFYRDSGIVRVRRKDFSYSLLRGSGRFLYFQSGAFSVYLKLGVAWFDKREFRADSIEKEDGAYILRYKAAGWYYLPFDEAPGTSDWWAMDNRSRPRLAGPDLDFAVAVSGRVEGDGVDIRLSVEGWEGVPFRLEFGLASGCFVESGSFRLEGRAGESILVREGEVRASLGGDALAIGPAFTAHRDTGGTYGSESRSRDHFSVYFTAFTPFDRVVSIRRIPRGRVQ